MLISGYCGVIKEILNCSEVVFLFYFKTTIILCINIYTSSKFLTNVSEALQP